MLYTKMLCYLWSAVALFVVYKYETTVPTKLRGRGAKTRKPTVATLMAIGICASTWLSLYYVSTGHFVTEAIYYISSVLLFISAIPLTFGFLYEWDDGGMIPCWAFTACGAVMALIYLGLIIFGGLPA